MNRGEDIFEADTNEDRQASAEFLILVLQCIQDWAQMFKTDRHQNDSVFLQTFQELQELGVTFPEFIPFFEDLRDKTPEKSSLNLLECKEMIIEVNKLMSQNSPDRNSIQNKIKWLVNWKTELENSPKKSTDFMAIQELGDDINKSYQIYRYWKKSEAKSPSKMVNLSSQNNEMPQIIHKSYRDVCPKAIPRASTPEIYEINHSEKEKAVSSWEPSPTKSEGIDLDIELDSEWTAIREDYIRIKDKHLETLLVTINLQEELEKSYKEQDNLLFNINELNKILEKEKEYKNWMTEKHEKDLHQLEKDLNFCNEIISGMEKSNKQLEVIRLDLTKKHQSKKDRLKLMTEKIAGLESEIDAFKSKDKNKRSQLVIESTYKLSLNVKSTMSSTQDEKTLENKQDLSRIIIDESEKIKIEAGNDIEAIDKDMISSSCFEDTYPVIHDLSPCSQRDSIDAPGTISFKQTLCRSDNEVFYPICLLSKCGIIYQDQIIQVNHAYDVEDDISRLHITVKDLTVNRLFDLKYEIIQISGLDISHNSSNSLMSDLYEIIIEFTRTSYIKDSPILKLSFASYDKLIKLPITEVLFLRSSIISDPQQTWHDLSSHKLVTKFQGLRSHIRSMKQLIESCNLHGKLKAAFVEGHRSLVLFGEFECPIMCKLSLNKSASAGKIEVRCSDETLRDIMSSLIKAQISSD